MTRGGDEGENEVGREGRGQYIIYIICTYNVFYILYTILIYCINIIIIL